MNEATKICPECGEEKDMEAIYRKWRMCSLCKMWWDGYNTAKQEQEERCHQPCVEDAELP